MDVGFIPRPDRGRRSTDEWHDLWTHREALTRIARPRCPASQDVDDVVQEAILRAAESGQVASDEAGPWLTRVVVNLCHDLHRRRPTDCLDVIPDQPDGAPSTEHAVELREEVRRVSDRFARLPDRQRQAIVLRAAGLSVDEVALELGTTYKTTESLLSRARHTLRGPAILALFAVWLRRGAAVAPATVLAGGLLVLPGEGAISPAESAQTDAAVTVATDIRPAPRRASGVAARSPRAARPRPAAPVPGPRRAAAQAAPVTAAAALPALPIAPSPRLGPGLIPRRLPVGR